MLCRAQFSCRFPPRFRRCRWVCPEEAGSGAVPDRTAKAALDRTLEGSPTSPRILAAMNGPTPGIAVRLVPVSSTMRAELVCDALRMAIQGRRPEPGLIFHSDRGSQYTSGVFRDLLGTHGMRQSLAAPGQCWDKRRGRVVLVDPQRGARPP